MNQSALRLQKVKLKCATVNFKLNVFFFFFFPQAKLLLLLRPLALQPTVGFGLSNNVLPFFPICHQLSPSSHSQHLKISFYSLFPAFPGSSPSSRPFQFLSEDLILCPFTHFTIFSPLLISSSSRFVRLFHSPFPSRQTSVNINHGRRSPGFTNLHYPCIPRLVSSCGQFPSTFIPVD